MSRPRPSRAEPARVVPDVRRTTSPPDATLNDTQPDAVADDDTHPADPTRTRSGRFKQDFVHNGTGRRGKRPKKGDTDLAALLRSIALERIEGSHPVTGKPLTVVEGLARSLIQMSFKQPRIGLAVLELMMRSGAVPMSAPDQQASSDQDAEMIESFIGRALRQERARAAGSNPSSEESGR